MYKKYSLQAIIVATIVALAGGGIYAYQKKYQSGTPAKDSLGINVEVERVRNGSLTRSLKIVGILEASNTVSLKSQVRGVVTKVFFKGGEEVKSGDEIFALDDRVFKSAYKEAEALHVHAKYNYQRAKKLDEKKFNSQKNLDEARAGFLKAEAGIERARKELQDTVITAPYEGIISLHKISVGTLVSPEMDLLKITDIDPLKVDFRIPAKFYSYLSIGQTIELTIDSISNEVFEGSIEAIDAHVDPNAQQIAVRGVISNDKRLLKPGLLAQVKIVVGSKDNSLIIPFDALETSSDQNYVYKVIEHPEHPGVYVVFKVPINIGIQEEERVEVTRGVYENDIIVTAGQQKLKDGYPVKFDLAAINGQSGQDSANTNENIEKKSVQADSIAKTSKHTQPTWWQKIVNTIKSLFKSDRQDSNLKSKQTVSPDPTSGKAAVNNESGKSVNANRVEDTDMSPLPQDQDGVAPYKPVPNELVTTQDVTSDSVAHSSEAKLANPVIEPQDKMSSPVKQSDEPTVPLKSFSVEGKSANRDESKSVETGSSGGSATQIQESDLKTAPIQP